MSRSDEVELERAAQRAAEKHLAACREAYWHEEMCGDTADCGCEGTESPASAPYDDCDTCVVREVLWAAWPNLRRLATVPR